jgi:2-polyprenyl-3-methyl-5-hydroxy-6-metoxy-1,4-benzoquinol methylase
MNPIIMYKNYTYLSGTALTMKQYFLDFVAKVHNNECTSILDIACNDGALLDYFYNKGYETFGIDPAENIVNNIKNHKIYCGFFNLNAIQYFNRTFDIITALNVFAHVDDIYSFLENLNQIATNNSNIYIQTSQCNMIQNNEFDTIYHEHLSFFNLNSIIKIFEKSNFYLHDIEIVSVHGNSYLFHLKKKSDNYIINYNIFKRLQYEISTNIYSLETYSKYEKNIIKWKDDLIHILYSFQHYKYKIICCGASAKGITIFQYLNTDLFNNKIIIDCFIDENKLKINSKIDSINIIIKNFDSIKNINQPILFILTAWNFKDEIINKINNIRNNFNDIFLNLFPLNLIYNN